MEQEAKQKEKERNGQPDNSKFYFTPALSAFW